MDQKELMQLLEEAQNAPVSYVDLKMATQRIKVDMDTRKITGYTEFGVIKDHLAENIIFEVKRYKGDTDLAEKHCAIHWENGENGGVLPVTEVDLSEDGLILMRWELSDEFTQYKGQIAYALHFFSILDGGFTYHAATNAAVGTLGDTLNASAHSKNKITPSEIEVYIAKMNELSAAMDEQVVLAQEAATKAESVAAQLAEKTGQIDMNTQKNSQHDSEIAALTQSKSPSIICQASGETIIATDSSDSGLEQLKTYGWGKQETTKGNQLLNVDTISVVNPDAGGVICSKISGGFYIKGTKASGDYRPAIREPITLKKGTYVLSHTGKYTLIARIRVSGVDDYGHNMPFTLEEETKVDFMIQADPGWSLDETIYPMLNEGSTPLPYEPYTGNIPSPNPEYPQPIVSAGQKLVDGIVTDVGISKKLTGKNLLKNTATSRTINGVTFTVNEDGSVVANGTADKDIYLSVGSVDYNKNNTYIVSGCPNGGSVKTYSTQANFIDSSGADAGAVDIGATAIFTPSGSGRRNVYIRIISGTTVSNLVFKPMIRLASIEDDTYEPYTEQTLTLNHVLRGIPLGTDIPEMFKSNALHMDGIYWNEEEQQYYIADTIDADRGVRVQRVGVVDLSTLIWTHCSNWEEATIDNLKYVANNTQIGVALAEKYRIRKASGMSRSILGELAIDTSNIKVANGGTTHAPSGIMVYALATPIETPLTDEEIIAYKTLHSNKPTTIITNDAGCFMEVEYVADTKTHIAQNYVPVTAFNNVLDRISALERLHV